MRSAAISLLQAFFLIYRYGISAFTPASCRYLPTCSVYAQEAVAQHGPLRGIWLALGRIARCHPLGGRGYDPVPEARVRMKPDEA